MCIPANNQANKGFDPEGSAFDYASAHAAGMRPLSGHGPNAGHYGSVVPASPQQMQQFNLPPESYMILKGRLHPTYGKAVSGEEARGYIVEKRGSRYFSVPRKQTDMK
jgi:peptidoglycan hydrolase-like protein with peptidoglycan-binding domain